MKKASFLLIVLFILFCSVNTHAEEVNYKNYRISGPYTYKNLTIFLFHGKSFIDTKNLLTLDEAITNKKLIVYETGNVGELEIENISDRPVFIQSGDIVKGGRQDRVLQFDLFVQPKSGRIPLNSFCVEHGRWSGRKNESSKEFNSSNKQAASKKLKLAIKTNESQQDVWNEVSIVQEKLSSNLSRSVRSNVSESSLQLTLENKDVEKNTKDYIEKISQMIKGKSDIVGFAFAINGEFNSADIYGSSSLFLKLKDKLLDACSTEALSEYNNENKNRGLSSGDLLKWLDNAEKGSVKNKKVNDQVHLNIKESDTDVIFETYTQSSKNNWIHKNIIKK
jgi:hypothetical protein